MSSNKLEIRAEHARMSCAMNRPPGGAVRSRSLRADSTAIRGMPWAGCESLPDHLFDRGQQGIQHLAGVPGHLWARCRPLVQPLLPQAPMSGTGGVALAGVFSHVTASASEVKYRVVQRGWYRAT